MSLTPATSNSPAPGGGSGSAAISAGNARAFQSIAQSIAISIQDSVDNLRNVETIATTATGVAMAQLLATGDSKYSEVIEQAQKVMTNAIQNFQSTGEAAGKVIAAFKS